MREYSVNTAFLLCVLQQIIQPFQKMPRCTTRLLNAFLNMDFDWVRPWTEASKTGSSTADDKNLLAPVVVLEPADGPKISTSTWHTVPGCGRVPLPKYALTASTVQVDRPDTDVCWSTSR